MASYFEYLREMFIRVLADIGKFLFKCIISPWIDLPENFNYYNSTLAAHASGFGFLGWVFWVIFLTLILGLIGGVGYLLYRVLSSRI